MPMRKSFLPFLILLLDLILSAARELRPATAPAVSDPQQQQQRELIIGGTSVGGTDRYPYFALMNGVGLCGAVLISERFVLTAAHCVGADDDFQIGITEVSATHEEHAFVHGIIHPDYDDRTLHHDIALFELSRDVPSGMTPIRLSPASGVVAPGTPLTVIGFGDTDPSVYFEESSTLRKTTVKTVKDSACERILCAQQAKDHTMGFRDCLEDGTMLDEGMLCGFDDETDSCQGDSGGPLILEDKSGDPSRDTLIGLVSWGFGCAGPTPGVYTEISHYSEWIVETMCALNPARVPDNVLCDNSRVDFPPGWTDSENDGCDWYAGDSRYCEEYGDGFERDGWVANDVCVVCGGGQTVRDSDTVDGAAAVTPSSSLWKVDYPQGWTDSEMRGCDRYAADHRNCEEYGHLFGRWGRVANDACAVCGGGKHVYYDDS